MLAPARFLSVTPAIADSGRTIAHPDAVKPRAPAFRVSTTVVERLAATAIVANKALEIAKLSASCGNFYAT